MFWSMSASPSAGWTKKKPGAPTSCSNTSGCWKLKIPPSRASRPLPPRSNRSGAPMRYIDEYRDPKIALALVNRIHSQVTKPWVLMEICGGQTHTLMRYGIDELIGENIELVHGPGCPVCVTPIEIIDKAIEIASRPGVIFVSYGDMLRVPGTRCDLFLVKSLGGDVRIAYSPMEAVKIAVHNPSKQVVFF